MADGAQGLATVKVDVGERGQKLGCSIVKSAGNASLDVKTCQVIGSWFIFARHR
jgi:TonB family protein